MKNSKLDKNITKLIIKKSTTQLRNSIIILIFSFIILSICLAVIDSQIRSINDNFVNNENTHIIEISGKRIDKQYQPISPEYVSELKDNSEGISCDVFAVYQLKFGMDSDELDEPIDLYSVDSTGEKYIIKDKEEMGNDIVYTNNNLVPSKLHLSIPRVIPDKTGVNIDDGDKVEYDTEKVEFKEGINIYSAFDDDMYFVNYDTYKKIYKMCFDEEISIESLKKIEQVEPIYKVLVYVHNIEDVDKAARRYNDQGYLTNFVFKSFDDIGEELSKSVIVMFVIAIILLIFTIINFILSMKEYVSKISKDIGILKMMGYKANDLRKIYGNIVHRITGNVMGISVIAAMVIGMIIVGSSYILDILLYGAGIAVIMSLLDMVVRYFLLYKVIDRNVLTLIKVDREHE